MYYFIRYSWLLFLRWLFLNFDWDDLWLRHNWGMFFFLLLFIYRLDGFFLLLIVVCRRLDGYDRLVLLLDADISKVVVKVIEHSLILHQLDLQVVVSLVMISNQVVNGLYEGP